MKILVVNNFFWPRTTGSAHFSEDVAARYVSEGHEVLVVTTAFGGAPEREEHRGYNILRVPCFNLKPGASYLLLVSENAVWAIGIETERVLFYLGPIWRCYCTLE